jgi:tRNA threonylcarbamoyladenosine biosynthesis protein TsaB
MRLIALDTATESVSAALADGEKLAVRLETERNRHTERLLPLVDEVLRENGLKPADLDVIAFGAGPGAFTGLRVACGVAQGLAWALEKPVVAVSNLQAAAVRAQVMGAAGVILIALDARMGECYAGAFKLGEGLAQALTEPELIKPQDAAQIAERFGCTVAAGSGVDLYGDKLALPAGVTLLRGVAPDAGDIARIALVMAQRGETTSAALASPLYVRNRVALTIEERARGERLQ